MKRKTLVLGFMLVALSMMGVIGSSAASAAEFHSAVHPQTVNANQTSSHVLTTDAGTATCVTTTFSGTTAAQTSATQTLAPNWDTCTVFGFVNVAVDENGCAFILHASGTSEIECPKGKQIALTVPFCTTTIPAQHISSGVSFGNNTGKTDIVITTNIKSAIDYNECGTDKHNASYTGVSTMTGASGSVWYE